MESSASEAGICYADGSHRIVECDETYLTIIQRDRADVIGRHPLELTFQVDRELNSSLLRGLAADRAAFAIRKRYIRGDGSLLWVTNHVAPVQKSTIARSMAICARAIAAVSSTGLEQNVNAVRRLGAALVAGRRLVGSDVISAPAVEILLKLYAAELEGMPVRGEFIAQALSMSSAIALRWLMFLYQRKLVEVEEGTPASLSSFFRISRRCELAFDEIIALARSAN